ncbi:DUF2135 domain-containing protein [Aureibaculum algae]|uniref:DUF2135 domain-containing protein n=1 Tax=Aureibaculum algae TaxID=2584122 RepID=A0A5B7TR90_9FLAO|nr:VIT domain-containing protein [Aureibaculum algae]QCX37072.1 DUF2135 domain-containing protein [Aureibaculum algae]
MKKVISFCISLFILVFGYAQRCPTLKVKNQELGLSLLDIKVDIVGNIATTTYDMLFYNPTNSVLEGELSFPLGEDHNVSRFALEVNGKLREAVVVEKELGRIAFENVVRRGVDPALLEKGSGNNYKARIYPIPAKGYKRVLLAYEQELVFHLNSHAYELPLNFKNKLDSFKLNISVFDQKYKPIIEKNGISELEFSNWNKNYSIDIKKRNYIANKPLLIKIPLSFTTEKVMVSDNYFYIYKTLSPKKRLRRKPNFITIYWDASLSLRERNIEKEINFLQEYFAYHKNVKVQLVTFSNTVLKDKLFTVKNGNWESLKKELEEVVYDGGTNYSILSSKIKNTDVCLLFTDGMATLSNLELKRETPVFVINSNLKSNHAGLKRLAEVTYGSYINLQTKAISEAISKMKFEPYKFLGYESNNNLEVYPVSPISVSNDFSISGKYSDNIKNIVLKFGYGNEVLQRVEIDMKKTTIHKIVERIWAQKKLENLMLNVKKNKHQITELAKAFSLVTKYTSLIVLEDIRDYVTYQITPPAELLEEYNSILAQQEEKNISPPRRNNVEDNARMMRTLPKPESIQVVSDEIELEEKVLESNDMVVMNEIVEIVEDSEEIEDVPFSIIEEVPVYPGCEGSNDEKKKCFSDSITHHFSENFNAELSNNLGLSEGTYRVYARFTINRRGNVVNLLARGPHRKLEVETVRVLRLLPKMIPGKQRGRAVAVNYTLPIVFKIGSGSQGQSFTIEPYVFTPSRDVANYRKYKGDLTVKERGVKTDYLSELELATNKEQAYQIYLGQRENYLETPAYFVDVANHFKLDYNDTIYSSRILSNIAEIDFDNYELLKVFAYQLQIDKHDDMALFIFKQILNLRPEDSQSYRDLAIAYQNIGYCQEALDLFNSVITGEIYKNSHRRKFKGIETIARNEIRYLIQKYKDDLDLSKVDKELLDSVNYDIRVVVDWNHNDTDIDLHIIDPNLEECFYSHNKTTIGGYMTEDMTQGFGPEEFTLKNAIKGAYYVKIKYFGDRYQKVENPTFMKVTIYKKFGTEKETKETQIIRLTKNDEEEIIAKLMF